MMYSLIYAEQFLKQAKKLPKEARQRIIAVLERIRLRPYAFVKRLVATRYYRLRVGKYRVILDILEDKLIILVLEVDLRKRIYK